MVNILVSECNFRFFKMPSCAAKKCSNSWKTGHKMCYFPLTDQERCAIWVTNINRENWIPNKFSTLCQIHFGPEMWEKLREDGSLRLKKNAIPTLFAESDDLKILNESRNDFEVCTNVCNEDTTEDKEEREKETEEKEEREDETEEKEEREDETEEEEETEDETEEKEEVGEEKKEEEKEILKLKARIIKMQNRHKETAKKLKNAVKRIKRLEKNITHMRARSVNSLYAECKECR